MKKPLKENISLQSQIEELKLLIKWKDEEIAQLRDLYEKSTENYQGFKDKVKNQADLLKDSVRKDFCLQAIAAAAGHYKDGNVF